MKNTIIFTAAIALATALAGCSPEWHHPDLDFGDLTDEELRSFEIDYGECQIEGYNKTDAEEWTEEYAAIFQVCMYERGYFLK